MLFKINLLSAKGEAEGFHRHLIALDPHHFLDVLVAGGVHYHQLKSECDARFSLVGDVVVSSWLCAGYRFWHPLSLQETHPPGF
jgi:hypothetical protein